MTAIVPGQASGLDDVLEYANLAAFPVSGKISKIYVALDSNLTYRWTGSTYAVLDPSLALGETSNTAYRGDRGKTAYDHSQATGNPHGTETNLAYTASATQGVVISDTGTDATIPAADGTNAGLFLPAEKTKLSGIAAGAEVNVNADWNAVSGDAQILNKPTVTTDHTALSNIGTNTHAQIDSHIASTANPHSITKTQVGLGNVANTDTTTTANITDSTDKRFVTDAQRTVLSNTGGINTGDNATNSQYSGLATSKQDALVSGTNIKTINSTSLLGSGNINLVTDGTNAGLFLPAEKTKLSGIAAGAEVNVNADWNAVSGDAQILNKPTVTTDHTALSNIGTNTHAQIDSHIASTANPHSITKTQVGLGNVANTDTTTTANITDSTDKRFVTDAQRTVLSNTGGINTGDNATNSQYSGLATSKQDALVSGTNIKTINSTSLLGSGNINLVTSPAGSTTQIQFNNAGAFGASSNLTYSGGQLLVASPATGTIPSVVKGFSGQTANLQEWRNSDGVVLACVSASGSVGMGGGVHP